MTSIVLPGDPIPEPPAPPKPNMMLKLGPGLTHTPPSTVTAHRAGELNTDPRKHSLWIESNGKRYIPSPSDAVLATVLRSTSDAYICAIPTTLSPAPSSIQALLPHLAFPQATKKTRPVLHPGATVYARVSLANKHMDPELECYDAESGKAEGFGELKGGMVFGISLGLARRLLGDGRKLRQLRMRLRKAKLAVEGEVGGEVDGGDAEEDMSTGLEVLEELGKHLAFEIVVGRNGRIWVDSADVKTTLCVGSCIQKSEYLTGEEQRKLVRDAVKAL
ncbi:exosome non-catalytic core subunit rrp40 [Rhizina undulata]